MKRTVLQNQVTNYSKHEVELYSLAELMYEIERKLEHFGVVFRNRQFPKLRFLTGAYNLL